MIGKDKKIFIVVIDPRSGIRHFLSKHGSKRDDRTGRLMLWPEWSTEPSAAASTTYEYAEIFRTRYEEEHRLKIHFLAHRGDDQFIEEQSSTPASSADERVLMQYRGLLAVPGMHRGERCFYVRFPGTEIESIRGESPEEAVDRVYARPDLLPHAEKAPAPVAVVEEVQKQVPEFKVRPGSR